MTSAHDYTQRLQADLESTRKELAFSVNLVHGLAAEGLKQRDANLILTRKNNSLRSALGLEAERPGPHD